VRRLLAAAAAASVVAGLAATPSVGATNECRGLNPCVPVAGPWVVVPAGRAVPRAQVQYQLTCPRGYIVAGIDAELSDQAIDLSFLGSSGTPVSPGVTTSRSAVFVAAYVGAARGAPTFRPHIGCIPAAGGGQRTPTGVRAVTPPGHPAVRRVVTTRVQETARVVASCHADERLVAWYSARGFATSSPPGPALVASLWATPRASGNAVTVVAHARRGQGLVQVSAVCAGGK
jgi:hypothetical protein